MMNVYTAYMACKDADFVRHTKDEYVKWEHRVTMTLKDYMASCLTKYKTLKMKGLWEAPSPEQEQIMALTAAVSSLRANANKPGKPKATGKGNRKRHQDSRNQPRQGKAQAWRKVRLERPGPKGRRVTHQDDDGKDVILVHASPESHVGAPQPTVIPKSYKKKGSLKELTAADITLQAALAGIEESDESRSESENE
jgi:hypothetical protein